MRRRCDEVCHFWRRNQKPIDSIFKRPVGMGDASVLPQVLGPYAVLDHDEHGTCLRGEILRNDRFRPVHGWSQVESCAGLGFCVSGSGLKSGRFTSFMRRPIGPSADCPPPSARSTQRGAA